VLAPYTDGLWYSGRVVGSPIYSKFARRTHPSSAVS
jgi:hypothetical protein